MAKQPAAVGVSGATPQPKSLHGHVVPPERMALILPHVAMLAETALAVGDTLPLQADAGDYARVLDEEAR